MNFSMLCICLRLYLASFTQNNTAFSRNKAMQSVANVKIEKNSNVEKTNYFHQAFISCCHDHHMKIHKEINYSFFREGYALAVAEILCKNECVQIIKIFS